ncbi:predicted protein [Postia placenta Mad-698-R]|nr:predicted protein [Postia placenta Mad-698-R]
MFLLSNPTDVFNKLKAHNPEATNATDRAALEAYLSARRKYNEAVKAADEAIDHHKRLLRQQDDRVLTELIRLDNLKVAHRFQPLLPRSTRARHNKFIPRAIPNAYLPLPAPLPTSAFRRPPIPSPFLQATPRSTTIPADWQPNPGIINEAKERKEKERQTKAVPIPPPRSANPEPPTSPVAGPLCPRPDTPVVLRKVDPDWTPDTTQWTWDSSWPHQKHLSGEEWKNVGRNARKEWFNEEEDNGVDWELYGDGEQNVSGLKKLAAHDYEDILQSKGKSRASHMARNVATTGCSSQHKIKKFNLSTSKLHSLGDIASAIRQYGTLDNYNTQNVHYLVVLSPPKLEWWFPDVPMHTSMVDTQDFMEVDLIPLKVHGVVFFSYSCLHAFARMIFPDTSAPGGFETQCPHRVGFVDEADPNTFGFLDPNEVLHAAHLIPHNRDWVYYYVNMHVDCNMFMHYLGGGIGHKGAGASIAATKITLQYARESMPQGASSGSAREEDIEMGDEDDTFVNPAEDKDIILEEELNYGYRLTEEDGEDEPHEEAFGPEDGKDDWEEVYKTEGFAQL